MRFAPTLAPTSGKAKSVATSCAVLHGWKFAGNGSCTHVPSDVCGESVKARVPLSAATKSWTCCERNDQILVWFDAEDRPPWYEVPDVGAALASGTYMGKFCHMVAQHIQSLAENGADKAHFDFVHDLGRSFALNRWLGSNFLFGKWQFVSPYETDGALARVQLVFRLFIYGVHITFFDQTINVLQIGPSMVHLETTSRITGTLHMIQTTVPEAENEQCMHHYGYSANPLWNWFSFIMTDHSVSEDQYIWNGLRPPAKPLYTKADTEIVKYRRWYKQFYSESSYTYQASPLDW